MVAALLALAGSWARFDDTSTLRCPDPEWSTAVQAGQTPRAAFRGPGGAVLLVCGDETSVRWIDPSHLRAESNYTLSLRQGDRKRILAAESEMMARPADVTASQGTLTILTSLTIGTSDRAYTRTVIDCGGSDCKASKPVCVLALRDEDDRNAVAAFDRAVVEWKKAPQPIPLEDSDAIGHLGDLLLLAATGDAAAKQRIRHFPIPTDGANGEIVDMFQLYLKEAEKLGCDRSRRRRAPGSAGPR